MQNENIIQEFCSTFNSKLTILKDGEHYFHTAEQLDFYKNWLNNVFTLKTNMI